MLRLAAQLPSVAVDISRRQVMCLPIGGQDGFLDEARDVMCAGLIRPA